MKSSENARSKTPSKIRDELMFLKNRFINRALARSRDTFFEITHGIYQSPLVSYSPLHLFLVWKQNRKSIDRSIWSWKSRNSSIWRGSCPLGLFIPPPSRAASLFMLYLINMNYSKCYCCFLVVLKSVTGLLTIFSKACVPKKENARFCFSHLFNKQQIYFRYNLIVWISGYLQNNWFEFCEFMRIIWVQGFSAWNITLYFVHPQISGVHLK